MLKAYKFRIYPNKEQEAYLVKVFGYARFIYNKMLADKIDYYIKTNKILENTPAQYKNEFPWLREVDSLALANAQLNLEKAYKNFFRNKSKGFPKFKSKKTKYQSFTTNNQKGTIYIKNNHIKIPRLENPIKIKCHRQFTGLIKKCTISKTPSNKYFISILVDTVNEVSDKEINNINNHSFVQLKGFNIYINNEKISNPYDFEKSQKKLKRLHKNFLRKQKGSNNRHKAKFKFTKLHEKITNQKRDFLHKLSKKIIRENQSITIENLKVSNIEENNVLIKLCRQINWHEFTNMLEYKAKWYGKNIVIN